MPEQQTKNTIGNPSPNHKKQIVALTGVVISFLVLLSLVSYSQNDQASGELSIFDLWKVVTNDEQILAKAEQTRNWLGLVGAILSNWLINGTVGYAVLVLPILGFLWSIYLLNKKNLHKKIVFTNYTLSLAILFASFAGTIRHLDSELPMEWSGVVGHFIAHVFVTTLGIVGAIIVLTTLILIVVTLLVDLDYRVTVERVLRASDAVIQWWRKFFEKRKSTVLTKIDQRKVQREEERELAKKSEEQYHPPVLEIEEYEEPEPSNAAIEQVYGTQEIEEESVREVSSVQKVESTGVAYDFPPLRLLKEYPDVSDESSGEVQQNIQLLRTKLADFSIEIENVTATRGPVVTLYEFVPASGVKISRIESLQDDIALALKARGIRIIAPMPGKGTVGVEIPNHHPQIVGIRSILGSSLFRESKAALPLALGKTISGEIYVDDLARMPHLLIAGATGSGKSVGINTIITSLLYRLSPSDVKFAIIDPKKIELTPFRKVRNHFLAVSPDIDEEIVTTPSNAVVLLKSIELEMEERYNRLAAAGVRNIADYNERVTAGKLHNTETIQHAKMPYIIVVVDELADLMITAAREVEEPIARLAQLARAVGIHLVVATQRPSVDVITGVIKANFPARIAYQVSSKIDSRTILDMNGAEQLLGNGDMLYLPAGSPKPVRIQSPFISTEEVEKVTQFIGNQRGYESPYRLPSVVAKKKASNGGRNDAHDELFEEAARIVVRHQQGSVSLLQRRLKIGYSRAARIIDELEAAGIVGAFDGKAREVLVETEEELEEFLKRVQ